MKVAPIWAFIPDKEVAARVKTRIIADAPTMQELYGNKNWINTRIKIKPGSLTNYAKNASNAITIENPWITNVIASNRIVATICREWVPEISKDKTVSVVYPIYENKVNLASGICSHDGKLYQVGWRYDRFIVSEIKENPGNTEYVYLTFGSLSFNNTSLKI